MSEHRNVTASGVIPPQTAEQFQPAQILYPTRTVVMHQVTDEEISALRGIGPTVSLTFFGIAVGAFGGCITTLETQSLSADSTGVFAGVAVSTGLIAILCLVMFMVGLRRVAQTARTIRDRATEANRGTDSGANWARRVWNAATSRS